MPPALKPPVDPSSLVHRKLLEGPFWQRVPAYAGVSEAEFLDHKWQAKNSITNVGKLLREPARAEAAMRDHIASVIEALREMGRMGNLP